MLCKRGEGVQVRQPNGNGWTKARRARFLDELAATCNVTAAARAAGKDARNAYRLKQRDGEFARLWAEAFAAGRERLHEALIARALGQGPSGDNPDGERAAPPPIAFDPHLALQVLKLQDGIGRARKANVPPMQVDIDVALLRRLEALAMTLGGS